MCHMGRGHSWKCAGLQQFLECPLALSLILHEGFKAQLLFVVQGKKCLTLGFVEEGSMAAPEPSLIMSFRTTVVPWCVRVWRKTREAGWNFS